MTTTITKRANKIINFHISAVKRNPSGFYAEAIGNRDYNGRMSMLAFSVASFESYEFQSLVWAEVANIVHETFLRDA